MSDFTSSELDAIDAMVAEFVMGIVWDEKRCRVCGWPIVPEGECGCWASNCSMRPPPSQRADRHAKYTRSGDAMLAVVEKMRGDGWCYEMGSHGGLGNMTDRTCIFSKDVDDDGIPASRGDGSAPTMPLAVALAALAAVGHPYVSTTPAPREPGGAA